MRALAILVLALALTTLIPTAAEAQPCDKIVTYDRCPWPGGVGEACVNGKIVKVCFGPI